MLTMSVLLISSDCHTGTLDQYQEYMEEEYREAYAEYVGGFGFRLNKENVKGVLANAPFFFYPDRIIDEYHTQLEDRQAWAAAGSAERLSILEREGYVGEILFPDAAVPFSGQFGGFGGYGGLDARTVELALAGQRAFNRRLADLIDPSRQVGCAVVSYADVDAAVATVHKAAEDGMRAVLLDGVDPSFPVFNEPIISPKYEPMWSAIEETGLVAQFHVGAGAPFPYYPPEIPREIAQIEVPSWSHRSRASRPTTSSIRRRSGCDRRVDEQRISGRVDTSHEEIYCQHL
jgi:Amidohydrolase